VACGPDPERHVAAITPYLEAGYDEVFISQMGSDQEGFFRFWEQELKPRLGSDRQVCGAGVPAGRPG